MTKMTSRFIYSVHTDDGIVRHHSERLAIKAARRAAKTGMTAKVWKFACFNGEPVTNLGCILTVSTYWNAKDLAPRGLPPRPRIVRERGALRHH